VARLRKQKDHGSDLLIVAPLGRQSPLQGLHVPRPSLRLDGYLVMTDQQYRVPRTLVADMAHGNLDAPRHRRSHSRSEAIQQSPMRRIADRRSDGICACAKFEADDRQEASDLQDRQADRVSMLDSTDLRPRRSGSPGDRGLTQSVIEAGQAQLSTQLQDDRTATPAADVDWTLLRSHVRIGTCRSIRADWTRPAGGRP
jgi:hypothetical protein